MTYFRQYTVYDAGQVRARYLLLVSRPPVFLGYKNLLVIRDGMLRIFKGLEAMGPVPNLEKRGFFPQGLEAMTRQNIAAELTHEAREASRSMLRDLERVGQSHPSRLNPTTRAALEEYVRSVARIELLR